MFVSKKSQESHPEVPNLHLWKEEHIPVLGLGTWQLAGEECSRTVREALDSGYRHIDTALMYKNQKEIGTAVKDYDRDSLFITSKVPHTELTQPDFKAATETILRQLGVDYLDLLLIHWPNAEVPMEEPLTALANLIEEGIIRSAGVSNFTVTHLKEALRLDIVKIVNNQVECHPFLPQKELIDFCNSNEITVTAYCPLAKGDVVGDKTLQEIAETHETSPAAVSLRWLLQRGLIAIPKSSSKEHLRENLSVCSWMLTKEEMERIDAIQRHARKIAPEWAEFDEPS